LEEPEKGVGLRILMSAVSADCSPAIVLVTVGADNIAIRGKVTYAGPPQELQQDPAKLRQVFL
jgi:hypothetical protein